MEWEWVYVQLDMIGNNGTGMGVCTTGHDRKQWNGMGVCTTGHNRRQWSGNGVYVQLDMIGNKWNRNGNMYNWTRMVHVWGHQWAEMVESKR